MLLKVSRKTPDKVIDAPANANIRGLIVRHSVRHLTCKHIEFLYISYVGEMVVPGSGLEPPTRGFSVRCSTRFAAETQCFQHPAQPRALVSDVLL